MEIYSSSNGRPVLHLHGKFPTGNENFISCGLNVTRERIITIICMQTIHISNIESLLQKILLKYLRTLQSKYIFFLVVIEQLLIVSIIFCRIRSILCLRFRNSIRGIFMKLMRMQHF